MNNTQTLAEFYGDKIVNETDVINKESAHFDVFDLKNAESAGLISLPYSHRSYYTIILLRGLYRINFEGESFSLSGDNLLFATPKIPFGLESLSDNPTGVFCIFNEAFISKENSGYRVQELPVFKSCDQQHTYALSQEDADSFSAIFNKLFDENLGESPVRANLQRIYALELIFNAQKLSPANTFIKKSSTAGQITCSFIKTLERQFPITSPQHRLTLKTVQDIADHLNLHPVYLNRQIKAAKGTTASDMISRRILLEAKILLKLNNWPIAEIASCLGFEEPAHFNAFFKKHVGVSPTTYRNRN